MKEATENELSIWLSTYGLITVERILERYKIRLQPEELIETIKNPNSFYHRLLKVPLKNVFNGIILQQANDYQVYVQKIFIDYLMSGESGKPEGAPGGLTREDLENERKSLVGMGEDFHQCEIDQSKLISASQQSLIQYAAEWRKKLNEAARKISTDLATHGMEKNIELITQVLNALLIQWDSSKEKKVDLKDNIWLRAEKIIGEKMSKDIKQLFVEAVTILSEFSAEIESSLENFVNQTDEMGIKVRQWRSDFHKFILRVNELIQSLPEYHFDLEQSQVNRESLYFDSELGGDKS